MKKRICLLTVTVLLIVGFFCACSSPNQNETDFVTDGQNNATTNSIADKLTGHIWIAGDLSGDYTSYEFFPDGSTRKVMNILGSQTEYTDVWSLDGKTLRFEGRDWWFVDIDDEFIETSESLTIYKQMHNFEDRVGWYISDKYLVLYGQVLNVK